MAPMLRKLWEFNNFNDTTSQSESMLITGPVHMALSPMAVFVCARMGRATECVHKALDAKL
jgi:hypothetical protein